MLYGKREITIGGEWLLIQYIILNGNKICNSGGTAIKFMKCALIKLLVLYTKFRTGFMQI